MSTQPRTLQDLIAAARRTNAAWLADMKTQLAELDADLKAASNDLLQELANIEARERGRRGVFAGELLHFAERVWGPRTEKSQALKADGPIEGRHVPPPEPLPEPLPRILANGQAVQ